MTIIGALGATALGLAVGSFLNVVIYRVPRGLSVVSPPSACPACSTPIRPIHNVPLASIILLRGRCATCAARIPLRYPLVEALTGALWAAAYLRFPAVADLGLAAGALAVLVSLAFIDIDHRRVPNVIVLPATAAAVVYVLVAGVLTSDVDRVVSAVASGAVGFVVLFAIAALTGGMGFGDVKLEAFIGVVLGWFGWETFLLGLFGGFMAGGLVGAALLASRRRGRKDAIPFAPMLCLGAAVALFAGPGPVRAWLGA